MTAAAATKPRLYAFRAPHGTVPKNDMVVGLEGEITIPTGLYLIEHPEGRVLFDTGLSFDAFDDPYSVYGPVVDYLQMQIEPSLRIDRQLTEIGLAIDDITHVVLSHAHLDHTGSLYKFPHAKFYVGPGEFDFVATATGPLAQNIRHADLEPTRDFDWTEVPVEGLDLFGDGVIELIHAPGHTPGQLVLKVALGERSFILTSDAVHLQIGLDTEVPDLFAWSDQESVKSAQKLKRIAGETGAEIWVHHDPDHYAAHVKLPEYYE
jgi:glyoxylase-like metal-dependent hydrolase (beta-lactamase superfamily II)